MPSVYRDADKLDFVKSWQVTIGMKCAKTDDRLNAKRANGSHIILADLRAAKKVGVMRYRFTDGTTDIAQSPFRTVSFANPAAVSGNKSPRVSAANSKFCLKWFIVTSNVV